jgi:hypothetical protein
VIPAVIGATGTISESLRKYHSNIPGEHDIEELHKTVVLGTAHLLAGSTDVKLQTQSTLKEHYMYHNV